MADRIRGRAHDESEKKAIIARLQAVWVAHPELRLSQLILNAFNDDTYYTEDYDLIEQIEKFYAGKSD